MAVGMEVARRRFIRAEYHRMAEVGILGHAAFVTNVTQLLVTRVAGWALVSVQSPVVLADDTEPQPDVVVLRPRQAPAEPPYKDAEPTTADVHLLIEVAETSLAHDRTAKLWLHAEAGVPEPWVVDGPAERVDVHRDPGPEGSRDATRLEGTATLSPLALPDVALGLPEIFA